MTNFYEMSDAEQKEVEAEEAEENYPHAVEARRRADLREHQAKKRRARIRRKIAKWEFRIEENKLNSRTNIILENLGYLAIEILRSRLEKLEKKYPPPHS
jgi:hypothetical protein